ncbi:RNA polymerase factor sigma-54 [bacterium]|nr:RNA polymerase factor sigma-54 [bacterium]
MIQQALKILQMPTLELANMVNQELAENPMLEEGDNGELDSLASKPEIRDTSVGSKGERTQEVDLDENHTKTTEVEQDRWNEYFWNSEEYEIPRYGREKRTEYMEPQVAKQSTLEEHLLWQFRLVCKNEKEFRIGELIIGNLDERGFFPLALEEIAQAAGCDADAVADALEIVQSLEPVGVGARNVEESLLIQLRYLSNRNELAETIVEKHFLALERHHIDAIARAEKISRDQVIAAAKVIAALDPYPGRHSFAGNIQYVIPDVIVEKHDDQYIIFINDDQLPELRLSHTYRKLMRKGADVGEDTKKFLSDKLQRATWLMKSIDQRRKTLYRVVETILDVQMDFFEKGIEFLKPLTLREIAERVELHESTISRVTSQKYIQTPRGLYEFKYFFSSQIKTADGVGVSSTSVKAALNEVIAQENPQRPLSDQKLTELLGQQGFNIARRTVAKYREESNILPASQRKHFE